MFWNSASIADGPSSTWARLPLAALVEEPLAAMGSAHAGLDAATAAHLVVARLSDHLDAGTRRQRRDWPVPVPEPPPPAPSSPPMPDVLAEPSSA